MAVLLILSTFFKPFKHDKFLFSEIFLLSIREQLFNTSRDGGKMWSGT